MAYYLEYSIPAPRNDAEFTFPVSDEHSGVTVPLTETDAPVVAAPELPARSAVTGATLAEAKAAAEEVIGHSRAAELLLYEDPSDSLEAGSGTLISRYTEGSGWTDS